MFVSRTTNAWGALIMPGENSLELQLLDAIHSVKPLEVANLINKGADPRAVINVTSRMPKAGFASVFVYSLYLGYSSVIQSILVTSNRKGIYIDLEGMCEDHSLKSKTPVMPMSKFHLACIYSDDKSVELLAEYYNKHPNNKKSNKTIADFINNGFLKNSDSHQLIDICHRILTCPSVYTIANFYRVLNGTSEYLRIARLLMQQFMSPDPNVKMTEVLPANKNGEVEDIEIELDGAVSKFEILLKLGLDPELLLNAVLKLLEKTKSPNNFESNDVRPKLTLEHIRILGSSFINAKGRLSFPAELTNPHNNKKKLKVVLTYNLDRVLKLAQDAVAAKKQREQEEAAANIGVNKLRQEFDEKLFAIPTKRIEYIHARMARSPNIKRAFDRIQQTVDSHLDLRVKAATGLITLNPSKIVRDDAEKALLVIKNVMQAANVAAQAFSPVPYVSLVPMILGNLVTVAENMHTQKVSHDVADAMLGKDLHRIAIDVAYLYALHAYYTFGEEITESQINKLVKKAVVQINKLPGNSFAHEAQLVYFLAKNELDQLAELMAQETLINDAMTTLCVPRLTDASSTQVQPNRGALTFSNASKGSSGSSSSGSGSHAYHVVDNHHRKGSGSNGSSNSGSSLKGRKHHHDNVHVHVGGNTSSHSTHSGSSNSPKGSHNRAPANQVPEVKSAGCCLVM